VAVISGEGDVWFDSVSVLIAALLTARWLQLRARRMAGDSTEKLLGLLPSVARRPDGKVVRADDLAVGDQILVKPGELIPVEGTKWMIKSDHKASNIVHMLSKGRFFILCLSLIRILVTQNVTWRVTRNQRTVVTFSHILKSWGSAGSTEHPILLRIQHRRG